jgi:Flp pilus assembly pilin Flp
MREIIARLRHGQRGQHGRRADQRGVAAVEAGLISALLSPLMIGVIAYGQYFWSAQRDAVTPQVDQAAVFGAFTSCESLRTLLRDTVVANAAHVSSGTPVQLEDVTAKIVDFVPGQVGVDAKLSVRVAVSQSALSGLLPNDGEVVTDAYVHLDNVRLDVQAC